MNTSKFLEVLNQVATYLKVKSGGYIHNNNNIQKSHTHQLQEHTSRSSLLHQQKSEHETEGVLDVNCTHHNLLNGFS